MDSRYFYLGLSLVIAAMVILLLRPFSWQLGMGSPKTLEWEEVRGSALLYKDALYTLNFSQQKELIAALNESEALKEEERTQLIPTDLGFEDITIYRFGRLDLTIHPAALLRGRLVFSCPEWDANGFFIESAPGTLLPLLSQAHDL